MIDERVFGQTRIPMTHLQGSAGFLDPAASKVKVKHTKANQAIVVVASYERWIFVLDAWRGRLSPTEIHEKVLEVHRTFRPRRFGCEANAMQSLFADDLNLVAKLKGVRLNIEPVMQPTHIDKLVRIRMGLQPVINFGRLVLDASKHQQLVQELTTFPMGTIDLVDALNSAIQLLPQRSAEMELDDTEASLRSYLQKVHMNPKFMEKRIAQWRESRKRAA